MARDPFQYIEKKEEPYCGLCSMIKQTKELDKRYVCMCGDKQALGKCSSCRRNITFCQTLAIKSCMRCRNIIKNFDQVSKRTLYDTQTNELLYICESNDICYSHLLDDDSINCCL